MKLNAWGSDAHNSFKNGTPIEFVMQTPDVPTEGSPVEVKFFNGNGDIDTIKGRVEHVEPGLIRISKTGD